MVIVLVIIRKCQIYHIHFETIQSVQGMAVLTDDDAFGAVPAKQ
jgi:hypothetical protein